MKGITPIISIIVLLLIAVALSGVAWVYLSGFMSTYTSGAFTIPPGGLFCSSGIIHMIVNNPAQKSLAASDFVDNEVRSTVVPCNTANLCDFTLSSISAGGHADFTTNCNVCDDNGGSCVAGTCDGATGGGFAGASCSATGCQPGLYEVIIGTKGALQQTSVAC